MTSVGRLSGCVLVGCILLGASIASAGQQLLTPAQAGGWIATAPDGANVALEVLGIMNDTLFIKKHAIFENGSSGPITIDFSPTGQTGIHRIVIDTEEIGNETSHDFTSFSFQLTGAAFDPSSQGFNTDPFPNKQLTQNNHELLASGGVLKSEESFFPGFGKNGGELVILANDAFTLSEGPGQSVPLPAALWTGASALLGLAVLRGAKRVRERLGF